MYEKDIPSRVNMITYVGQSFLIFCGLVRLALGSVMIIGIHMVFTKCLLLLTIIKTVQQAIGKKHLQAHFWLHFGQISTGETC